MYDWAGVPALPNPRKWNPKIFLYPNGELQHSELFAPVGGGIVRGINHRVPLTPGDLVSPLSGKKNLAKYTSNSTNKKEFKEKKWNKDKVVFSTDCFSL
jgi:hypothetical protein